jgi:hypothetical protein
MFILRHKNTPQKISRKDILILRKNDKDCKSERTPSPHGERGNKKKKYCKTKCNLKIVRLTATIFMTAGCV